MGFDITSFYIYRIRYWIGYIGIGLLLAGLLVFAGLYTPGGISDQEVISAVKSSQISLTDISSLAITNLPHHLLQQASFELFGVSDFSIKLPSLLLALLSAIGLILLLQRWFTPRTAVLASLIAISTGQFLFIAQSGTPGILYVLWSVWLLLLATLIAKQSRPLLLWKILFFVVAALSLYTPLSIYAIIAMAFAALLHPHLRYIIRQLSKIKLLWGAIIGAIIIAPLVIGMIRTPELALQLLGIPAQWPDIFANLGTLFQQYFGFITASTTGLMTPVFGLGSMILIGIGLVRLIKTRDSTQSYLIIIWMACLLPILIVNPLYTSITFLPLVLLLATGLGNLLGYWYRLFPRNPYARIAGLIPIVVLVGVLMMSGLERYIYGYHYDPKTVPNFSRDLSLLPDTTTQLVVAPSQLEFYTIVQTYNGGPGIVQTPSADAFTATKLANRPFSGYSVEGIVTSNLYVASDRFYVYKKDAQ